MERPNIIFVFSDQQRWDTLGCLGQALDVTPNLDKMAEEGVLFANTFTCQPVCGPARACIQSGLYATETGCTRNGIALPLDQKTIAHYFRENGYEVGYIGKWHLASTMGPVDHDVGEHVNFRKSPIPPERRGGYEDFWLASDVLEWTSHGFSGHLFNGDMEKVEFEGYRVDCLTDFILDYLEKRTLDKPFFLFVSYIEPHHQNDQHRYVGPKYSKEKFKDYVVPGDLKGTKGDWRESFPDYLGCCHSLDKNFQRIRDKIEELGIKDNTCIFYTSDHGSHFRTRNREYKRSCHEASIHVPLVVYGPGFKGGKKVQELVSLIDYSPTLLKCADINPPDYMKGIAIQEIIKGNKEIEREAVFLQISESQVGRAIRTKKWKYSIHAPRKIGVYHSHSDLYEEQYLYDLENDPHERNNLVKDKRFKEVRAELAEILKKKMAEANEKVPEIVPKRNVWEKLKAVFKKD
ncbi:MAG: sulfatase-like hydrolase/transferase [Candidatus Lokiarchaeota archaeon]|nr:sulfatase-like hydrolase/transferase [Candidatus Lokiarchaeota archaeon]